MREIKFRAWDTKNKEMVNDIWIAPHYGWLVMTDNDAMAERERPERNQWELMQFTGLYDKNGKEIYEGDILKCERDYWETPRNLVVEWNEDCWSLLKTDDPVDSEVLNHNSSFNVPEYQREVIGNIYENPELAGRTE